MATALVTGLRLVAGIVLLLANGFFVTAEFAMTRVRQFGREEFTGHPGLERAWAMTDRLEIYLSGCQVGITVSSVGLGVVAEPAVAALFGGLVSAVGLGTAGAGHGVLSVVLALALINLLHVIVGEQAPTYLGVERTRLVCRYCARPLYWWTRLMSPVILSADRVAKGLLSLGGVTIERSWAEEELESDGSESRADVRREMGERLRGLGLSEERREEVLSTLDIGRIPVSDIMVERDAVVALSTADPFEETRAVMARHPHSRFPLVDDSLDEFEGIVYTPSVLRHLDALASGKRQLADVATGPLTLDAGTTVSECIDRFQDENQELALVTRDGTVVGLVTATDAFEAITGELEDPLDAVAGG